MFTLIYRKTDGTDKYLDFSEPMEVFNKFYPMLKDARKSPFISSSEHIGMFNYKNVEWYMLNDEEGKKLALNRFMIWCEDFRIRHKNSAKN
jgi:hypothetical protein